MRTFKIHCIKAKAARMPDGELYLNDCKTLAESWDEASGVATFTADAVAELRATWAANRPAATPAKHCKSCGGL